MFRAQSFQASDPLVDVHASVGDTQADVLVGGGGEIRAGFDVAPNERSFTLPIVDGGGAFDADLATRTGESIQAQVFCGRKS